MPDTSVSPANAIAWAGARGERLAPFVPSPQAMVDRMLTIARAGPGDMVYDLGSGDGQIVLAAAQQFGARGTGIEIDDDLVRLSSARIAGRGLGSRARIIHGDFLDADLRPATIVTLYQLPAVNELLRPMLEAQLRPGARVVSLDFPVPGWNPDRVETATLEDGSQHAIYLYPIVRTREVAVALQQRSYAEDRFAVEIDGVNAGFVRSVEGGNASSDVITEKLGPDGIRHKHIAGVKYEDVAITCGVGMSKALYSWVAATLTGTTHLRKDGAIIGSDYTLSEVSRLNFYHALMSEVAFPALDSGAKDAAYLAVRMSPEYVRRVSGSRGKIGSGSGPAKGQARKQWLRNGFRLDIPGLVTSAVTKIDAITVRQVVEQQPIGELRDYEKQPAYLDVSDLAVELAESHAESFYDWIEDFVVKGNSGANAEKNGTLQYLAPNGDVHFTLNFHNLGIFTVKPLRFESGSEDVRRVRAEMYCEAISFNFDSGALSEIDNIATTDAGSVDTGRAVADKEAIAVADKDAIARATIAPLRGAPVAPERLAASVRGPGLRFRG